MKKTFLALLILMINIVSFGAVINGTVKIDPAAFAAKDPSLGAENFGVFVFSEQTGVYDITDAEGKFKISGLEIGKEYTLVCQKKGIKDHKEKVKISKENEEIIINIKPTPGSVRVIRGADGETIVNTTEVIKYRPEKKFNVTGIVKSKNEKENIYINFRTKGYGFVARPNQRFEMKLEAGEYSADIEQEGMYSESIDFKVEKDTELQTVELSGNRFGIINIELDNIQNESVVYAYKDEQLKLKQNIDKGIKRVSIPDLKQGNYKVVIKTPGYKDFAKKILLRESAEIFVKGEEGLANYEQDKIFFSVYPETLKTDMILYDKTGAEIARRIGVEENSIEDAEREKGPYRAVFSALGYKEQVYNGIEAGQRVQVFMEKEKENILISGTIHPFTENVTIEIVGDKGKSVSKTDKYGNFVLKAPSRDTGKKIIKVYAEGYEEQYIPVDVSEKNDIRNFNIELKMINTSIKGRATSTDGKAMSDVMVILEEINMWTETNENGEYTIPLVQPGRYNLVFKKMGYSEIKKKVEIFRDETNTINVELAPYGMIVFKSNVEGYEAVIEESDTQKRDKNTLQIDKSIYSQKVALGRKRITVSKEGYKTAYFSVDIKNPGEERELRIFLEDTVSVKIEMDNRLNEAEKYIEQMEIEKADRLIYDVKKSESKNISDSKEKKENKKIGDLEKRLDRAKKRLYDGDNAVRRKLKEIKTALTEAEESDLGYTKKRELLEEKYKEGIDYTEKILTEYYYTTLKFEIYTLQGDIYMKLGMTNSAQKSYDLAKKFK